MGATQCAEHRAQFESGCAGKKRNLSGKSSKNRRAEKRRQKYPPELVKEIEAARNKKSAEAPAKAAAKEKKKKSAPPPDWTCPKVDCGNLNWAKRNECNKCQTVNPAVTAAKKAEERAAAAAKEAEEEDEELSDDDDDDAEFDSDEGFCDDGGEVRSSRPARQ